MRLYSYVVRYDYGFAPNPFFGFGTLATCKPRIRQTAQLGDWIVGTGSRQNGLGGHLVYAMQVSETLTFEAYWRDKRFRKKRPNLRGSLKRAFGDNIYHRNRKTKRWLQENSHHSRNGGRTNLFNLQRDTGVNRVLVAARFTYWGGSGPKIPARFSGSDTDVLVVGQGHKCRFPPEFEQRFVRWIEQRTPGYAGDPYEFAGQLARTRLR